MPTLNDLRSALRRLVRSPIFALTAIASLSLGVAAVSTVFSLADALLFRPARGIRNPPEVVDIGRSNQGEGFDNMSHPVFEYLRAHATTLSAMSAVELGGGPMSLTEGGASERVTGTLVSGTYFQVLGTRPAIGRLLMTEDDAHPGERPVVVLSHAFWQSRFAGHPAVLHAPLRLNGREFAVVGVAEPGFEGLTFVSTDLWLPISMVGVARGVGNLEMLTNPEDSWHTAVGRLAPGVTAEQAQAELNTLIEAYKAEDPRVDRRHRIAVVPTGRVPPPVRLPFTAFAGLLFLLTGALLAIACSNVTGMLMARAALRRREVATRLALGASHGRLIGLLLIETLLLFAGAGVAALPVTLALTRGLESFLPVLPAAVSIGLAVDPRVVAFSLALTLLTAVVSGLVPARQAVAGNLASALHGAHATADHTRTRLRNALVIAQVALSLMLVVTAMLFVRTLRSVALAEPGYRLKNVHLASIDVSLSGYREQAAVALVELFIERIGAIDGVTSVSCARMIPLQGSSLSLGRVRVPGYQDVRGGDELDADWNVVSPRWFETVGLRLVEGRDFSTLDRADRPFVAIVNQTFASHAWPGRSGVGRHLLQETAPGEPPRAVEVVGVAADARYRYFGDPPTAFVYVPMAQQPLADVTLFVRHAEGHAVAREVRDLVAQLEPTVPVIVASSFEAATTSALLPQRLAAWIAGSVGATSLLLACLGLYGLMAFVVAQRSREIAIRMTLGASSSEMRSLVLRQAGRLAAVGGAAGLLLAGVVATLVRSLLVGVPVFDPFAFGGTALLFAAVLAAACSTPARRAAATDPATALRNE